MKLTQKNETVLGKNERSRDERRTLLRHCPNVRVLSSPFAFFESENLIYPGVSENSPCRNAWTTVQEGVQYSPDIANKARVAASNLIC